MGEKAPHQLFRHLMRTHTKDTLAAFVVTHPGYIHSEHGPEKWTKEELCEWVVESEYGAGAMLPGTTPRTRQ